MPNPSILVRGIMAMTFTTALLAGSAPARAGDSETDRLLALLVKKHMLTEEEAASVRAEVREKGQDVPAPIPDAGQQPASAKAADTTGESVAQTKATPGLKEHVQEVVAKLPFTISGYGQVEWSSLPGAGSTFRLHRGRVSVDGEVGKLANYKFQVDAVNAPSLLDAYLRLNLRPYARLTMGQFKVPFSQENLRSSSDLLTVERSQVVNSLVPGRDIGSNGRDIGVDVGGSYNLTESAGVDYAVGIFNGAGIDRKDDNNRKDFAARLAVRPFRGLALAGDYYNGGSSSRKVARDRQGAELAYTYHPLTLQGEFIWGHDGGVAEQGWYGLGAWRFSKQWEGVFRVDNYDPNRAKPGAASTTYLGGFNWYFAPGLKWQLNYGLLENQNRARSLVLSQVQFKF